MSSNINWWYLLVSVCAAILIAHTLAPLWVWLALHKKKKTTMQARQWRVTGILPPIQDCPDDSIETLELLKLHTIQSADRLEETATRSRLRINGAIR